MGFINTIYKFVPIPVVVSTGGSPTWRSSPQAPVVCPQGWFQPFDRGDLYCLFIYIYVFFYTLLGGTRLPKDDADGFALLIILFLEWIGQFIKCQKLLTKIRMNWLKMERWSDSSSWWINLSANPCNSNYRLSLCANWIITEGVM